MINPKTVTVTLHNVHIPDSYREPKKDFFADIEMLRRIFSEDSEVFRRSNESMEREWATHNFCYMMGWWKERTKDVDLNYPLPWYMGAFYWVAGWFAMLFIP